MAYQLQNQLETWDFGLWYCFCYISSTRIVCLFLSVASPFGISFCTEKGPWSDNLSEAEVLTFHIDLLYHLVENNVPSVPSSSLKQMEKQTLYRELFSQSEM